MERKKNSHAQMAIAETSFWRGSCKAETDNTFLSLSTWSDATVKKKIHYTKRF